MIETLALFKRSSNQHLTKDIQARMTEIPSHPKTKSQIKSFSSIHESTTSAKERKRDIRNQTRELHAKEYKYNSNERTCAPKKVP